MSATTGTSMTSTTAEGPGDSASRGRRTAAGLGWSAAGIGSQALGQLVLLVVLARLLTPAEFGVVTATVTVVGLGKLLTQQVVSATVIQRGDLTDDHIRAAFWLSIGTGAVVTAALVGAAPALARWFDMPQLAGTTRVLAAVFLLQSAALVAQALLERSFQFRQVAIIEVFSYGIGFVGVGVAFGLAGAGVWAVVAAHAGQAVLQSTGVLLARRHPKAPRFRWRSVADLGSIGGGFAAARAFNFVALQGDNVVVGHALGASALGAYGRAYQLLAMPAMLFGQIIDRVLFPVMADLQGDHERLGRDYRVAVSITVVVMAPASVLLVVLGPEVVRTLLGAGWDDVVAPLQILALGLVPRTAYKMSDTLAKATGHAYARAGRQAVYAALVILGATLGQRWGLVGVAVAVTAAIVVNHVLMAQLCLGALGLSWRTFAAAHLRALPPAIATAVGCLVPVLTARTAEIPAPLTLGAGVLGAAAAVGILYRSSPTLAAWGDLRRLTGKVGPWRGR